jgi:ClpP class serine protease
VNAISAGAEKLMGAWWRPMTDAERAKLQAEVDKIYNDFKGHVLEYRPNIPDSAMQGNVFDGKDAMKNNLVDDLIFSFSELLH